MCVWGGGGGGGEKGGGDVTPKVFLVLHSICIHLTLYQWKLFFSKTVCLFWRTVSWRLMPFKLLTLIMIINLCVCFVVVVVVVFFCVFFFFFG